MRVLVTGGAGFIGSAVCRHFISDLEYEVVVVDKLTYAGNLASLAPVASSPHFAFEKHDICDAEARRRDFCEVSARRRRPSCCRKPRRSIDFRIGCVREDECDWHIHAARGGPQISPSRHGADFRFIHVSTDEVYGSLGADGLFTETTAYDPSSPYSATKAASDHLAKAWHRTYGVPVIVSNCSNNYGPYHFPEKLIPLIILNALDRKPLPVYGDGSNVRDWLYVEDHARALGVILAKGVPGETYNIGGRNERKNIDVVRQICSWMDQLRPANSSYHELISFVTDRPGHDQRYAIDATKLETELGWRAQETFETGIEKTVRWYLDNDAWWQPLREKVYSGERLGLVKA